MERMGELTFVVKVDYAHRLLYHTGKCRNLHGHTGKIVFYIRGPVDEKTGMVLDFAEVRRWLEPYYSLLDHSVILNPNDPLVTLLRCHPADHNPLRVVVLRPFCCLTGQLSLEPTAENMAFWLFVEIGPYRRAGEPIGTKKIELDRVEFWESEDACGAFGRGSTLPNPEGGVLEP